MGVTHETATRSSLATAIRDEIDTSGGGYLLFETSSNAEVARIDFATPNCGSVSSGVLTFTGTPVGSDTTPAGGTIAKASFYDGAATKIMTATVSTSTSVDNVQVSSLTIATTDTVTLNSLSWTAPS